MIGEAKKGAQYKNFGDQLRAETVFRTLGSSKVFWKNTISIVPDVNLMNESSVSIGPLLSEKRFAASLETKVSRVLKTMVFQRTDKLEV